MTSPTLATDAAPPVHPAIIFTVGGAILAKWNSLGGPTGLLGAADSNETGCPDGVGRFNRFQNGMIYWTPKTGAWSVHGLILAKWASLGYERCAFLGYPISDETGCPDGVGRFNRFQNGMIYWTPKTGAWSVHGLILAKWASLGYERCAFLGYPISDESGCPDGVGRFNRFQNGMIYWTPATGAFSVHGAILDKWASLGYEKSALGYPTSDEGDLAGGGRVSSFQHGRILWTADKGAWVENTAAPLPPQIDYNFSPIVFDNGVPVGGNAHLTVKQDGSYIFSGHFHDSGATAYNMSLIYALKDSEKRAYSFAHTGHVAGTFESGSRDDDWNVTGTNPAIASNWQSLVSGTNVAKASANLDILSLGKTITTALGEIVQVIEVVGEVVLMIVA